MGQHENQHNNKTGIYALVVVLSLLFITSCGFTPRQSLSLPVQLSKIELQNNIADQRLINILQQQLAYNGAVTLDGAPVRLTVTDENISRRLLSVFATGQVAEYELEYSLRFLLSDADNSSEFSIEVRRDYQDDPKQVLAKSRELELLMSELRLQITKKLVRELPLRYRDMISSAQ